jgi:hypothetical protein
MEVLLPPKGKHFDFVQVIASGGEIVNPLRRTWQVQDQMVTTAQWADICTVIEKLVLHLLIAEGGVQEILDVGE